MTPPTAEQGAPAVTAEEDVMDRWDRWVAERPDDDFLYYGPQQLSLSFGAVDALAEHSARGIGALAGPSASPVAVLATSALTSTIVMTGCFKSGRVFAPVNSGLVGEMLRHQLANSGAELVVVDEAHVGVLDDVLGGLPALRRVVVANDVDPFGEHPAEALRHRGAELELVTLPALIEAGRREPPVERRVRSPWEPAQIIYTSGTTGPSKGVVHPRRWLSHHTMAMRHLLTPDDMVYSDMPMYHVGGASANVVRAMSAGCGLALWDKFSTSQFWDRIAECGATAAIIIDVMIDWLRKYSDPSARFNTLNKVNMAPLRSDHAQIARQFGFDFVQASFGMTECGGCLWGLIEETAEGAGTPPELYRGLDHAALIVAAEGAGMAVARVGREVPPDYLGRPIPYVDARIVDEHDQPLPDGQPGELVLRTATPWTFFSEYNADPAATAAAFRNMWYHTGDICRRDEQGDFYFVDRRAFRIRRRGENVSTYHIEAAVQAHEDVNSCAALPVPGADGDEDEVALFVMARPGRAITAEQVRAWCAEQLPRFMWPMFVEVVDEIPQTPTNKVEKSKLLRLIGDGFFASGAAGVEAT